MATSKRARTDEFSLNSNVVHLNVGGKRFLVSIQTANSFAMIRKMLDWNGSRQCNDELFIDRDPVLFDILLQSVRACSRPPQNDIVQHKGRLIEECAFYCVNDWVVESISGKISGAHTRLQDREIRATELSGDFMLVDPFQVTFTQGRIAELGLPLLEPRQTARAFVNCTSELVLRERLNALTGGLVDRLAFTNGILIAGGAVVCALMNKSSLCGDVDVFLHCQPEEGISKIRAIFNAVRLHAVDTCQGNSSSNIFVTRTAGSVTIFSCVSRHLNPIQVVLRCVSSIKGLLSNFDVDCCAVAFDVGVGKAYMTPRAKRAFEFAANLADSRFDSPTYIDRLYKYTKRGFGVVVSLA